MLLCFFLCQKEGFPYVPGQILHTIKNGKTCIYKQISHQRKALGRRKTIASTIASTGIISSRLNYLQIYLFVGKTTCIQGKFPHTQAISHVYGQIFLSIGQNYLYQGQMGDNTYDKGQIIVYFPNQVVFSHRDSNLHLSAQIHVKRGKTPEEKATSTGVFTVTSIFPHIFLDFSFLCTKDCNFTTEAKNRGKEVKSTSDTGIYCTQSLYCAFFPIEMFVLTPLLVF